MSNSDYDACERRRKILVWSTVTLVGLVPGYLVIATLLGIIKDPDFEYMIWFAIGVFGLFCTYLLYLVLNKYTDPYS